ncbi:MAG: transposase [Rhodobacteraceae bacterium]|nr:transposase [Paracoccaceae bacterium]
MVAARGAPEHADGASAHAGLAIDHGHASVNHSKGEYVRKDVHANGIESFRSMLKRVHKGAYDRFSGKHPGRYVTDFFGRYTVRERDTLNRMCILARGMTGPAACPTGH